MEDDRSTARPPGPRGPLVLALSGVVLVLVLLALTARTASENPVTEVPDFSPRAPTAQPSQQNTPEASQGPQQRPPGLDELPDNPVSKLLAEIVVALLVIAGVALAAAILFLLVRTLARRQAPEGIDEVDGEVVVDLVAMDEHLERSTSELDVEGDVNQAIVRCWEGLEMLAAEAGATRDPAQTAREFTVQVLQQAALPPSAMDRLADLYEAALFSGSELPDAARDEAVRALNDLRAAVSEVTPS